MEASEDASARLAGHPPLPSLAPTEQLGALVVRCPRCQRECPASEFFVGSPDTPTLSHQCHVCLYEAQQLQQLLAAQVVDDDAPASAAMSALPVGGGASLGAPEAPSGPAASEKVVLQLTNAAASLLVPAAELASAELPPLMNAVGSLLPASASPRALAEGRSQPPPAPSSSAGDSPDSPCKSCMHCGESKLATQFRRSKNKADGLQNRCKACEALLGRGTKRDRSGGHEARVAHKLCRRCEQDKPADRFFHSKLSLDGLCTYCKACQKELNRSARARRPQHRPLDVAEKECRRCKLVRPANEYFKSRMNLDGLYSYCRGCATTLNSAGRRRRRAERRALDGSESMPGSSAADHVPGVLAGPHPVKARTTSPPSAAAPPLYDPSVLLPLGAQTEAHAPFVGDPAAAAADLAPYEQAQSVQHMVLALQQYSSYVSGLADAGAGARAAAGGEAALFAAAAAAPGASAAFGPAGGLDSGVAAALVLQQQYAALQAYEARFALPERPGPQAAPPAAVLMTQAQLHDVLSAGALRSAI